MKKFLAFLLFFYVGVVVFMPKSALFYKGLELLYPKIKTDLKTKETPISLNAKGDIYYADIKSATIDSTIYPFILINAIDLKSIDINSFNLKLKNVKLLYSPLYPIKAWILGEGINGEVDLKKRVVQIVFKNPPNTIKGMLKRTKKGYELNERY